MANTEQRVIEPQDFSGGILTVQANGGVVLIEVQHEPGVWVVSDTINADGAFELTPGRSTLRISPSGGATWALH